MGETPQTDTPVTIGKYRILGTLGRGAMGVVYKGQDPQIGRIVAIKVLRSVPATLDAHAGAALERFKTEARSAGNLRHPRIITVFEVSSEGETPYIVMDYLEGEGLDAFIQRSGRLDPETMIHILEQVADGLDHAHSKGVVHRDIKPSNISIDKNGGAFILDFGVASIGTVGAQGGPVMGSPGYMSPEQILNKDIDFRTDIFSLGVLAFECLTATRPFPGDNFTAVVSNILNAKPRSLTEVRPDLPLSAEAEIEQALSKRREDRFPTARAFIDALKKSLGLSATASGESGAEIFSRPRVRKQSSWTPIGGESPPKEEMPARTSHSVNWQGSASGVILPEVSGRGASGEFERPQSDAYRTPAGSAFEFQSINKHPGGMFQHASDSLSDITSQNNENAARGNRIILALMGTVCLVLGLLIVWMVFGAGIPTPDTEPQNSAVQAIPFTEAPPSFEQFTKNIPHEAPALGKTISEMSDREILGILVQRSHGDDTTLRALEEARRRKIPDLVDAAVGLLQSDSYVIRIEATKVLASSGEKRIVPALVIVLEDHDPLVRSQAARALMLLGDRKAVAYLQTRLIREDVNDVKLAIRRAIERLNGYPLAE